MRKFPLVNDEFYHIFNRGVAKMPVFTDKKEFGQGFKSLIYYSYANPRIKFSRFKKLSVNERSKFLDSLKLGNKLVDILAYVLMPNHFHLLVKQTSDNGISTFLRKFTNSYTKYFNLKRERVGPLFQGIFKSVHIEDDNQLIHLSRYIHLNPLTSNIVSKKDFKNYQWSSFNDYISGNSTYINLKPVLSQFSTIDKYIKFVIDQADYQKKLKRIGHLLMEK